MTSKKKDALEMGSIVKAVRNADGKKVKLLGVVVKHTASKNTVLFENGDEDQYKLSEELMVVKKKQPSKPKLLFCAVVDTEDEETEKDYVEVIPVFSGNGLANPAPYFWVVPAKYKKQAEKLAKRITAGKVLSDIHTEEKRGKMNLVFDSELDVQLRTSRNLDNAYELAGKTGRRLKRLVA